MTVADESYGNAEDLEVYVDGEAAAQADSYSEVQQSAREGDEPRYLVRQDAGGEAATDVVVGIDHFSERQVSVQKAGDGRSGGDDGGRIGGTDGDGDGFGVLAALAALAGALVVARRL